jgi:hypothetical protein
MLLYITNMMSGSQIQAIYSRKKAFTKITADNTVFQGIRDQFSRE